MGRSGIHVIRRDDQLAVLACAARQEIVDVLAAMGTVSVAELAAVLGRPADAQYFHLRALQRTGLVRHVGYRYRKGRKEALFRAVAPELRLHYEPRKESNRKRVTAIVASMLRLGIRDFRRAFHRPDVNVSGPRRELWALRTTARLSLQEIAQVQRSIVRLKDAFGTPRGQGRLYAITVLLTPLDRRRESKKGKKKRRRLKRQAANALPGGRHPSHEQHPGGNGG